MFFILVDTGNVWKNFQQIILSFLFCFSSTADNLEIMLFIATLLSTLPQTTPKLLSWGYAIDETKHKTHNSWSA